MDLRELSVSLVSSTTINCQTTASKLSLFTVPTGKVFIPVVAVFREPSATLAGMIDFDLGGNALCDDWLQQVSLAAFTATTDQGLVAQPTQAAGPPIVPAKSIVYAAAVVFGMYINTGSTGAANVKVDLYGYLFDA